MDSGRTSVAEPLTASQTLSAAQIKSGVAAWLGWMFDGLDTHLYTLVAPTFVAALLHAHSTTDQIVASRGGWIQAAFMAGWAVGGTFFGSLGDRIGRARTLSLTILTYACFTGLSSLSQTWWQLLIFRFIAALGIGGEWGVGSSLLAESWPPRLRPWAAAVLQTGINVGVLLACATTWFLSEVPHYERYVFVVGILPAFVVLWIRRSVPEPDEWKTARRVTSEAPRLRDLFERPVGRTTLLATIVCACSLTAWWAFMFWSLQHLRNLPELSGWTPAARQQLASTVFFILIAVSIAGNFFASWLAASFGYRRATALMFCGFFAAMFGAWCVPRGRVALELWMPAVGFFSGVFGLFTMYLPPLFPTLLRTTAAGFSFNIGRLAAAAGIIFSGYFGQHGNFRIALLVNAFLIVPAILMTLLLPDLRDSASATSA